MSGKELLVDTNILIKLLAGDDTLTAFLDGRLIYVSFITELEMHGLKNPSPSYATQRNSLLSDCFIIPLNADIQNEYIRIRQQTNLKLADAVIAATAVSMKLPLLSGDAVFTSVNQLNFMHYESD